MVSSNTSGSPLASVAAAAGSGVADAFELLGDETRLAILLALWEAYDPHGGENAVPFSALRDRVGLKQGAQFNYHLDRLVGRFVEKSEAGYELTPTGLDLVQSVISGTGIRETTFERTEIDDTCGVCGAPTAVTYQEGRVHQLCTRGEDCPADDPDDGLPPGTLVAWVFEPTGVGDRSARDLFAASTVKTFARICLRFEGVCPDCSGPVEWSFDVCEDHDTGDDGVCSRCGRTGPVLARETCTVCKSAGHGRPAIKVLFHPAVVAFYHDHGIDVGFTGNTGYDDVVRTLELVDEFEETVVSTDPLRVRVSTARDGDELHLLLDETMTVREVSTGD